VRKLFTALLTVLLAGALAACESYEPPPRIPSLKVGPVVTDPPDGAEWGVYGRLVGFDSEARRMVVDVTSKATPNDENPRGYPQVDLDTPERIELTYPAGQFRCGGNRDEDGYGPFPPGLAMEGLNVYVFGKGPQVGEDVIVVRSSQMCYEAYRTGGARGDDFPVGLTFTVSWGI
jgi:hypothetical protein